MKPGWDTLFGLVSDVGLQVGCLGEFNNIT